MKTPAAEHGWERPPPGEPAGDQGPLLLRQCGECGYSLRGLPEEGHCPECGQAFGPYEIVLFGWDRAQGQSDVRHWTWRKWPKGLSVWNALTLGWIVVVCLLPPTGWFEVLPMVVVVGAVLGVIWWQQSRLTKAHGAPAQLRLTTKGSGRRLGVGPVAIRRWPRRTAWAITACRDDLHRLTVRRPLRWQWLAQSCLLAPVDFQFRATDEEVRLLRLRIDRMLSLMGELAGR